MRRLWGICIGLAVLAAHAWAQPTAVVTVNGTLPAALKVGNADCILLTRDGRVATRKQMDLTQSDRIDLTLPAVPPGQYQLDVSVDGTPYALQGINWSEPVKLVAGPSTIAVPAWRSIVMFVMVDPQQADREYHGKEAFPLQITVDGKPEDVTATRLASRSLKNDDGAWQRPLALQLGQAHDVHVVLGKRSADVHLTAAQVLESANEPQRLVLAYPGPVLAQDFSADQPKRTMERPARRPVVQVIPWKGGGQ